MENIQNLKMRSDFGPLMKGVDASFLEVFDQTKNIIKPVSDRFFTVKNGDGARAHFKNIGGVERIKKIPEGNTIPELAKYLGDSTDVIYEKFGGVVSVTYESIGDNEWKGQLDLFAGYAEEAMLAPEIASLCVLKGGFTNASEVEGYTIFRPKSNEALFSSSHALANGGTASNVLTDSAPLSPASLAKMKAMIMKTPSESGEPMLFNQGFQLIVPTELLDEATRIVQSTNIQGNNNNDINTHKNIEIIHSPYLDADFGGSDTAYFLVAKGKNGLLRVMREDSRYVSKDDVLNEVLKKGVVTRFAVGFRDWRGVVGSKGDSSTYSG